MVWTLMNAQAFPVLHGDSLRRSGPFVGSRGVRRRMVFPCADGHVSLLLMGAQGSPSTRALMGWMDEHGMLPAWLRAWPWEQWEPGWAMEASPAGIHVLVIRDVPAFRQAAPDCALAHAEDLAECSLPQDEAVAPASPDRHAAEQVPGVVLADFTDAFCHHQRCFQVADDILAYRDVNHITAEMAQHLAGRLEAAARVAMG